MNPLKPPWTVNTNEPSEDENKVLPFRTTVNPSPVPALGDTFPDMVCIMDVSTLNVTLIAWSASTVEMV